MENTTDNRNRGFGSGSMISSYSIREFIKDALFPLIVSFVFWGLSIYYVDDTYALVCKVLEISLSIIPAMIALMLTAYVFVMSFLFGKNIVSTMKNLQKGQELFHSINASFGISLLVNVSTIIIFYIMYIVSQIKITVEYADTINSVVVFFVSFLVLLSVSMQIGIVIDLYNCGQVLVRNSCED